MQLRGKALNMHKALGYILGPLSQEGSFVADRSSMINQGHIPEVSKSRPQETVKCKLPKLVPGLFLLSENNLILSGFLPLFFLLHCSYNYQKWKIRHHAVLIIGQEVFSHSFVYPWIQPHFLSSSYMSCTLNTADEEPHYMPPLNARCQV